MRRSVSSPIGAQKFRRARSLPQLRPWFEPREILGPPARIADQSAVGRVAERTQHARDVFERRLLGPPLGQRPRGLAFKIDNDVIGFHSQHLAQMIIAVDPDPLEHASLLRPNDRKRSRMLRRRLSTRAARSTMSSGNCGHVLFQNIESGGRLLSQVSEHFLEVGGPSRFPGRTLDQCWAKLARCAVRPYGVPSVAAESRYMPTWSRAT